MAAVPAGSTSSSGRRHVCVRVTQRVSAARVAGALDVVCWASRRIRAL